MGLNTGFVWCNINNVIAFGLPNYHNPEIDCTLMYAFYFDTDLIKSFKPHVAEQILGKN